MRKPRRKVFVKIYLMAGDGYALWFKNYTDANDYARAAYKGKRPWYGRAARFYLNTDTGEIKRAIRAAEVSFFRSNAA